MTSLKIKRIRCDQVDAALQLRELLARLSSNAEVVSEKGRLLTERVFGEALPPVRVVERICEDIKREGLPALLRYTEQLDNARLDASSVRVGRDELVHAHQSADAMFLATVQRIRQRIMSFQSGLVQRDAVLSVQDKYELRLRYRPMQRVGVCVPGGAASYPSTLLMTVCPAQAAGVREIAIVMPPTPNGAYNSDLLAVCHELGIKEVYRVGGAQAVAALAFGVDGIRSVDMIVGPGNLFVTLAKKFVFGQVAIDCLAGPSEIVVLADDSASADYVAADLIAQAEHDPGTSILISWCEPLVDAVEAALTQQLNNLPRGQAAQQSLDQFGALVLARSPEEAIQLTNQLGPEHLHIQARSAQELANGIRNAGAIFVGEFTPVALGDYAAGPSHVLPTGGTSRFASGLSANDFLQRCSLLEFTRKGMEELAGDVRILAHKEGLAGHAASVGVRLKNENATVNSPSKEPATSETPI